MHPPRQSLGVLTLSALGVVYGDIGTSPLYTMKEVFNPDHSLALNAANVVGAVSTILCCDFILPQPGDRDPDARSRNDALARGPVCHDVAQRRQRRGFLSAPPQLGG